MEISNANKSSFKGIVVSDEMSKFQKWQANKLVKNIKNLDGYNLTDEHGITIYIASFKDKSGILPRNIFKAYFLNNNKTDVAKRFYSSPSDNVTGKSSKVFEYVESKLETLKWTKNKIDEQKAKEEKLKTLLHGLDPESIKNDQLKNEILERNFEYDKENKILFLKENSMIEKYDLDGNHTKDLYYLNGNLHIHESNSLNNDAYTKETYYPDGSLHSRTEGSTNNYETIIFDKQGRKIEYYSDKHGIYTDNV